ncbi:MAG: hypothetical protein MJZ25_16435 [Fibrobacter sp.]|nr:hypothetical protein [Fibrobacter sp.]
MDISNFLKRIKSNQVQLAESLGTNPSNVCNWAKGKTAPSYKTICQLIKMGMVFNEIFGQDICNIEKANNPTNVKNLYDIQDLQKALGENLLNQKTNNDLANYLAILTLIQHYIDIGAQNPFEERIFDLVAFLKQEIQKKLDKTASEAFNKMNKDD